MIFWCRVSGHHTHRVITEERARGTELPAASGQSGILAAFLTVPGLMSTSWASTQWHFFRERLSHLWVLCGSAGGERGTVHATYGYSHFFFYPSSLKKFLSPFCP